MYYECSGMDVSDIITKINTKLDSDDQLSASASVSEIVAAIDTILEPIITLCNTKSTTTLADTASTSEIVAAFKTISVSVAMEAKANYQGSEMWRAELTWSGSGNSGSKNSSESTSDVSTGTVTQAFTVFDS